jgi:4-diphosphocytidyl-2C-methyl-D-erythritol kinase
VKRLNGLTQRRPLNPQPRPVADFAASDFADNTMDAFELACQEADAERLEVGVRLVRLSGSGPACLKVIDIDAEHDRITCNSSIGGPDANSVWSASELSRFYAIPDDAQ